ncbi:hypothetical protein ACTXG6_39585 [Pseudonocardia sp. Cha107L01]|uniref:hypothetical protein n=1 Tax=Pseudonocardia sp. Cha107L01 TaxID=3457576 RepID=UPI00403E9CB2
MTGWDINAFDMSDVSYSGVAPDGYFPDGLDETAIDQLIGQVATQVTAVAGSTSALVDGSAAERRRRRMERRVLAAVVRSLPARQGVSPRVGEAA